MRARGALPGRGGSHVTPRGTSQRWSPRKRLRTKDDDPGGQRHATYRPPGHRTAFHVERCPRVKGAGWFHVKRLGACHTDQRPQGRRHPGTTSRRERHVTVATTRPSPGGSSGAGGQTPASQAARPTRSLPEPGAIRGPGGRSGDQGWAPPRHPPAAPHRPGSTLRGFEPDHGEGVGGTCSPMTHGTAPAPPVPAPGPGRRYLASSAGSWSGPVTRVDAARSGLELRRASPVPRPSRPGRCDRAHQATSSTTVVAVDERNVASHRHPSAPHPRSSEGRRTPPGPIIAVGRWRPPRRPQPVGGAGGAHPPREQRGPTPRRASHQGGGGRCPRPSMLRPPADAGNHRTVGGPRRQRAARRRDRRRRAVPTGPGLVDGGSARRPRRSPSRAAPSRLRRGRPEAPSPRPARARPPRRAGTPPAHRWRALDRRGSGWGGPRSEPRQGPPTPGSHRARPVRAGAAAPPSAGDAPVGGCLERRTGPRGHLRPPSRPLDLDAGRCPTLRRW